MRRLLSANKLISHQAPSHSGAKSPSRRRIVRSLRQRIHSPLLLALMLRPTRILDILEAGVRREVVAAVEPPNEAAAPLGAGPQLPPPTVTNPRMRSSSLYQQKTPGTRRRPLRTLHGTLLALRQLPLPLPLPHRLSLLPHRNRA